MSRIGHIEVCDGDVVRFHFRSNVRYRELARNDATAFDRPVFLYTHKKNRNSPQFTSKIVVKDILEYMLSSLCIVYTVCIIFVM